MFYVDMQTKSSAHAEIARHASQLTHAARVQNSTFFHMPLVFVSRNRNQDIAIHEAAPCASRLGPSWPRHWPILSCADFHCLLHCITWPQSARLQTNRQMDWWMDGCPAHSRLNAKRWLNAHTDVNKWSQTCHIAHNKYPKIVCYSLCMRKTKPQSHATGTWEGKFGEVWQCGSWDMLADMYKDGLTDREIWSSQYSA